MTAATHDFTVARRVGQRIWGSVDSILLMFAGSAAEFALNKAVNWLFVTNALPNAPIERFFETVQFAQAMVFGSEAEAAAAVAAVNRAHRAVQERHGGVIPQWSYRDTLFMLVYYGETAYEVVFAPLSAEEREQHFLATMEIGRRLGVTGLPDSYDEYRVMRENHLQNHLERSAYTDRLYAQYRAQIGPLRMQAMRDVQASIVPDRVAQLLGLKRKPYTDWLLRHYRSLRRPALLRLLYPILLPDGYGPQLARLERAPEL